MQLRALPSLLLGRPWLNSSELANGRCHAALSDGKHMSTEVDKPSLSPALTQPQYNEARKGVADASLALLVSLSALPTMSRLFLLFPRNCISRPTRSAKKRQLFTSECTWFQKSVKY